MSHLNPVQTLLAYFIMPTSSMRYLLFKVFRPTLFILSHLSCACYMLRPSHPRYDHRSNVWRGISEAPHSAISSLHLLRLSLGSSILFSDSFSNTVNFFVCINWDVGSVVCTGHNMVTTCRTVISRVTQGPDPKIRVLFIYNKYSPLLECWREDEIFLPDSS